VSQASGVLRAMHGLCAGGQLLAYGWGRNAPALTLPHGVGFEVGGSSGFTHAVLEVHYLKPPWGGGKDNSGVILHITAAHVPQAGVCAALCRRWAPG